jgi:hypothetical protein
VARSGKFGTYLKDKVINMISKGLSEYRKVHREIDEELHTGGGSNSPDLTSTHRSSNNVQHCADPITAIFGARPEAQIFGVILRGFHKNRGFTGDFNFMREKAPARKNNEKGGG